MCERDCIVYCQRSCIVLELCGNLLINVCILLQIFVLNLFASKCFECYGQLHLALFWLRAISVTHPFPSIFLFTYYNMYHDDTSNHLHMFKFSKNSLHNVRSIRFVQINVFNIPLYEIFLNHQSMHPIHMLDLYFHIYIFTCTCSKGLINQWNNCARSEMNLSSKISQNRKRI